MATQDHYIRRVGIDGIIQTVAGNGSTGYNGDGMPAATAQLNQPQGMTVDDNGVLFVVDQGNRRIRQVDREGIITTVAWDGATSGFGGDGGPALQAAFNAVGAIRNLALDPEGNLYVPDASNHRIRRVGSAFSGFAFGDLIIPSEDGSELYRFTSFGRHLQTLDPLTGAPRLTFNYDPATGLLSNITDADGQVMAIERNGSGNPSAVVAPGGQRTTLTATANGHVGSIANPAQETFRMTYTADGLMTTFTTPRNHAKVNSYDSLGRLTNHQDAANGSQAFARTELSQGWQVDRTTAENRVTRYTVERLGNSDQQRTVTDPAGLTTTSIIRENGTTTITAPDGTVTTQVEGPDPRFGMQAPIMRNLTVATPGGLTSTLSTSRSVTLTTPGDPLSLATQSDTLTINGQSYTIAYDHGTKIMTTTSPEGRMNTVTFDSQGRVVEEQVANLEPVTYTYRTDGLLETITYGTGAIARTTTLSYNSKRELTEILDAENRMIQFDYDLAGRMSKQTFPDLRESLFAYNTSGSMESVTPPGRLAHTFTHTPVDLEATYDPPDAGFSPKATAFTYNKDRQLELETRPDGRTIDLIYDVGGRLGSMVIPSGTFTYDYHPTTGNLVTITAIDGGTLSYTYDGSLRTSTTWAGSVAGTVSRIYNNDFSVISQSVNGAHTINLSYDGDGLVTNVGALTIAHDPQHGLITGSTLGVAADSRIYNTFGELEHYSTNVSGSTVFETQFTRDKLGRITQKIETIGGVMDTYDYTYDLAGWLTEVKKNGTAIETYTYDDNGNRLTFTDGIVSPAITVNGTYDGQDRLLTYGDLQFAYSNNGELETKTNPTLGQTALFSYDVLGSLKSITLPNGDLIDYIVDGKNRRIGKKINGTLNQGFLYQNQINPVAELDGLGNVVSRFVYGTNNVVPDYMDRSGVTYRLISDHVGSVRLVINTTTGATVQRIDYDAFGNILTDTNPGFQPFGFAGGLYDPDTGLTHFGFRDYEAQTGRWTVKDPIGFDGGPNFYSYVLNDPVNSIDPWGLDKHHIIPRQIWKDLNLQKDVRSLFDKTVVEAGKHGWDKTHAQYNAVVKEMWGEFFKNTKPENITKPMAELFIDKVRHSPVSSKLLKDLIAKGKVRICKTDAAKAGKGLPGLGLVLIILDELMNSTPLW